ncbi:MAG: hypothetical protein RR550_03380, partial [Rikenellaceae bacterium]
MEIVFIIVALLIGVGVAYMVLNPEKKRIAEKYDTLLKDFQELSIEKGALTSRCEELGKQIAELKDENGEKEQRLKSLFENI